MSDECPSCGCDWENIERCGCNGSSKIVEAADALTKAVNTWAQRGYDEREDDMRQAVEDARAAYEKARGLK